MRRNALTAVFGVAALAVACVFGLNGLIIGPAAIIVALNAAGIIEEHNK